VLKDTKTSSFLLLIVPFLLAIAIPDIALISASLPKFGYDIG
jgi:hypothetical protein